MVMRAGSKALVTQLAISFYDLRHCYVCTREKVRQFSGVDTHIWAVLIRNENTLKSYLQSD